MREGYQMGDAAALLRVRVERLEKWVATGWLKAEAPAPGPGYRKLLTEHEIAVAKRALRIAHYYGVKTTRELFERCRREEEKYGKRDDSPAGGDQRDARGTEAPRLAANDQQRRR